jgi:NAD-dependent dihydropyrimidine dehydrogenase PreA subunit
LVKVLLKFSKENTDEPITSQVILEKKIPINILSANIDQNGGELLVEIERDEEDVIRAFRDRGVRVETRNRIEKDNDRCIDCGACISICPMDAYSYGDDLSVELEEDLCIGSTCGLCVDACPHQALKLVS